MWIFKRKSKDNPTIKEDVNPYPLTWKSIDTAPDGEFVDIWVGYTNGFRYANVIKLGGIWCDKDGHPLHFRLVRFWIEMPPQPE